MVVMERRSSALSIPVAFRAGAEDEEGRSLSESRSARERGFAGFLAADLSLEGFADLRDFSSSAMRASRSAFLRAASAFLASAASLVFVAF